MLHGYPSSTMFKGEYFLLLWTVLPTLQYSSEPHYQHYQYHTNKPEKVEVYSDISGLDPNRGTIPPDVLATQSRPHLVLLDRNSKMRYWMELTCSCEKKAWKTIRYTSEKWPGRQWLQVHLAPFEIGSRGHVSKSNRDNIVNILANAKITVNPLQCIKNFSMFSMFLYDSLELFYLLYNL